VLVDFLGEDRDMSATALDAKGPNKALFRTAALAGSAIIWGTLGYLALTYVPKIVKPVEVDIPAIPFVKDPPKYIPPPPVLPPLPDKPTPTAQTPNPAPQAPTTTVRTPDNPRPTTIPSYAPAGEAPLAPAIGDGDLGGTSIPIGPVATLDPPIIAVPPMPEVVPDPPMPKLVINPVKMAGANPSFPTRPLEAGISGEVTLSFTVTTSGRVEGITILSEEPRRYGFARAAQDAISSWTFQPQTIDGIPVAYPARYTISFKLED
jgi:periplasmic protein TonB